MIAPDTKGVLRKELEAKVRMFTTKAFQITTEAWWHIGMSFASYTQSMADQGSNPGKGESNLQLFQFECE